MQRRALSELTLAVGLVGPGAVGRALLEHMRAAIPKLKREGITLEVRSILNSYQMMLAKNSGALDLSRWDDDFLTEGVHVVTPNKRLNSGPLPAWRAVKALQAQGAAHYMYEGTVGAGLPIISTLKTLLDTGDEVTRIEGVLSGTLSYIFNNLKPGDRFSEVVWGAKRRGYTEPDAREDLAGMDVTRKIVTLARECGTDLEMGDVVAESLIPEELAGLGTEREFMSELARYDDYWDRQVTEAEAAGEVLRYVGSYDGETGLCKVGPRRLPKSHPFASLTGTECIVSFSTTRYANPPLIVRGPGAGPAMTAAGVFGDVVTLARYLGAHS